jgi:HK97 family phage major capsid protein
MNHQKLEDFNLLADSLQEVNALSKRSHLSKQEERRFDALLATISALKAGAMSATEIRQKNMNDKLIEAGERPVAFTGQKFSTERRAVLEAFRQFARNGVNRRTLEAGVGTVTHTTLASGGAFVPVGFFNGPFQHAVATADPLFDKDVVTYLETEVGGTIELPLTNDTDNNAVVITENTKDSEQDSGAISQIASNVFAYRTPKIFTSIEFGQDALADYAVTMLENFFIERIARGVGVDLIKGNGAGVPLGLIPSLEAVGVSPIVAVGSSGNDGVVSNDGTNSIGSDDLSKLYTSVQARYRSSPKAAWLMNDTTFQFIAGLKNKFGGIVFEGMWLENPTLFSKPVHISPSMDNIGAGKVPVVFGDLSHWMTRHAGGHDYVRNYREFPGAVEFGKTAWSCFARYGGQLLMSNATRPAINYIINHT